MCCWAPLGGKLDRVEPRSGYVGESGRLLASGSFLQLPICNLSPSICETQNSVQDHHQGLNTNSPSPPCFFHSPLPFYRLARGSNLQLTVHRLNSYKLQSNTKPLLAYSCHVKRLPFWFTSYSHPCPAHILRAFHQGIFQDGTFPQDFSATLHKQTFTQKSTLFDAFIHNLLRLPCWFAFSLAPFPLTYFCALSIYRLSTHYVPLTLLTHVSLTPFSLAYPLVDAYLKDAIPLETFSKKLCTIWRTHEGRYAPLYQPVLVHAESFLMCLAVIALGGKSDSRTALNPDRDMSMNLASFSPQVLSVSCQFAIVASYLRIQSKTITNG